MQSRFSIVEISRITGIPDQTLLSWQDKGVLVPREVKGSKRYRLTFYDQRDVFAVAICASLRRQGIQGPALLKVLRFLTRANLTARIEAGEKYLIVANGTQAFSATPYATFKAKPGSRPVALVVVDLQQAQRLFQVRLPAALQETETRGRKRVRAEAGEEDVGRGTEPVKYFTPATESAGTEN